MTVVEFYDQCLDNVIQEMLERLSVKRDSDGKQYIQDYASDDISKESFFELYEYEIGNPWDEIEDYNKLKFNEEQVIIDAKEVISESYDKLYARRIDFCKTHGIDEFL